MVTPHGLGAEHLTQEERRRARELVTRMVRYCDEVERVDGTGDACGE
jgi:hypothetical protein